MFFLSISGKDVQQEGQHHEGDGDPLGHPGQLGIHVLGLILGQEGIGNAADGPGEAGALAGLEQHHGHNGQGGEKLYNGENNDPGRHGKQHPFR